MRDAYHNNMHLVTFYSYYGWLLECYLAIIICCLHMRQLMVDKYQWNHCAFSFSNKSYVWCIYTHAVMIDISLHILIYFLHTRISPGRHFRTYNEENLYKCRHCEKSISVKSHLKVHVISHSTENNYQCIDCNKPSLNNVQIKYIHLFAHIGEKIY